MEKGKRKKGQRGSVTALPVLMMAIFGLSACGAPSSYIKFQADYAALTYFGEQELKSIAVKVRQSLGLPLEADAVPKVEFTRNLPGECTRCGCPVAMYRAGTIFILQDLEIRYHEMALAHELIHHYSKVHGLGLSEDEVIAKASGL